MASNLTINSHQLQAIHRETDIRSVLLAPTHTIIRITHGTNTIVLEKIDNGLREIDPNIHPIDPNIHPINPEIQPIPEAPLELIEATRRAIEEYYKLSSRAA